MQRYIDLGSVIDVEPELSKVFDLIEDDDFIEECSNRFSESFARELVNSLSKEEVDFLKEIIEEYD